MLQRKEVGSDYVKGDLHDCFPLLKRRLKEIDRLFSVGKILIKDQIC
jgi:hypothetical protein